MHKPAGTIYAFDQYRLDPVRRILTRASGEAIGLKPKAFDTLLYLVEHPLELIDKDVLLREIWPNVTVEENNLNQHISALRRALGETPGEHRFIVTEPRRGYRFVASVEQCKTGTTAPSTSSVSASVLRGKNFIGPAGPRGRMSLRAAVALIGGVATSLLLILLLSNNDGPDASTETSSRQAQMAQELPTTSKEAMGYYNTGMMYMSRRDHLGRELPLAARQFQLSVDADPEFALGWARLGIAHLALLSTGMDPSKERQADARRAVQRALALNPELPEARLALARVRFQLDQEPESAMRELEHAALGLPAGSEIWMARADFELRMGHLEQAIESARRATAVDEATRLAFEASVETYRRNFDRAERLLERLFDLYPDNAQTQRFLATMPLNRDGSAYGLAALAKNPDVDEKSRASAGWFAALWDADREAALAFLEQIPSNERVRQFGSFNIALPLARAQTLRAFGERERAMETFRSVVEPARTELADNPGHPGLLLELADGLVGSGQPAAGVELGRQLLDLAEAQHDVIFMAVVRLEVITRVLIPAGQTDFAIDELDLYLSQPGIWSIEGLMHHPLIQPIRDQPAFVDLAEKYERRATP
jgi:DNA-binding winged helix-turn-helix (wHTH) protein